MIARSWLYVPGDDPDRLAKAAGRGADALIVDLEDGVAPGAKDTARGVTVEYLRARSAGGPAVWVRVNSDPDLRAADMEALEAVSLDGIVVPKAEDAGVLRSLIGARTDCGWMVLVETALGINELPRLLACEGVTALQVGEADLRADLGVTFGSDESELQYVRQKAVVDSVAAGIGPPVAPVSTEFRNLDVFRAGTEALARMGYVGRACIHPAQIAVAHEVFTPTADRVAWAQAICTAAEEAYAAGQGAFVGPDGRMADEAVVRSARRVLALAR